MASSKLRSSCSFPNLLLSCLNFILFILSSASIVPIILLKTPPTSLGWALLISSLISLLTSFIGFYSQFTQIFFMTHISFLLASLASQLLSFVALFTREKTSLSMLDSQRDPREAKVLVRLECGILMVMFLLQVGVLVLTCGIHSCWVREYEGLEAQKEAVGRKRSRRIAEIQEEPMVNVSKELDEKMMSKCGGKWVKNDFQG